jgi:hypothetical protein
MTGRGKKLAIGLALAIAAIGAGAAGQAAAAAMPTRVVYAPGRIVPIPASIPHEAGDMVDSRIVPDLRWIASRFPIFVTDGYSGPLPGGGHAGCNRCHTRGSDHYLGLAVDLVPAVGNSSICNAAWKPITRLANWAEPVQNSPIPPFRWIGYDGDAGHGCGNHLHLSWNHAPSPEYTLAAWVEVLAAHPTAGLPSGRLNAKRRPKPRKGPPGGVKAVRSGGVSPRGGGYSD